MGLFEFIVLCFYLGNQLSAWFLRKIGKIEEMEYWVLRFLLSVIESLRMYILISSLHLSFEIFIVPGNSSSLTLPLETILFLNIQRITNITSEAQTEASFSTLHSHHQFKLESLILKICFQFCLLKDFRSLVTLSV